MSRKVGHRVSGLVSGGMGFATTPANIVQESATVASNESGRVLTRCHTHTIAAVLAATNHAWDALINVD
jgi:hypothetical protein